MWSNWPGTYTVSPPSTTISLDVERSRRQSEQKPHPVSLTVDLAEGQYHVKHSDGRDVKTRHRSGS